MAAEKIGQARCPVCKSGGASVSLSKKNLVCLTCNACNLQIFARSGRSDELVRAYIVPASAPAEAPKASAAPIPSTAPAAPAVAPAAPVAEPPRAAFGLGKWLTT